MAFPGHYKIVGLRTQIFAWSNPNCSEKNLLQSYISKHSIISSESPQNCSYFTNCLVFLCVSWKVQWFQRKFRASCYFFSSILCSSFLWLLKLYSQLHLNEQWLQWKSFWSAWWVFMWFTTTLCVVVVVNLKSQQMHSKFFVSGSSSWHLWSSLLEMQSPQVNLSTSQSLSECSLIMCFLIFWI